MRNNRNKTLLKFYLNDFTRNVASTQLSMLQCYKSDNVLCDKSIITKQEIPE